MSETPQGQQQVSVSAQDVARAVAGQRSFVNQAVVTLLLYWLCFYLPGLVANIVWLMEAGRVQRESGRAPAGKGCLHALLLIGILPWIVFGVSCVACAGVTGAAVSGASDAIARAQQAQQLIGQTYLVQAPLTAWSALPDSAGAREATMPAPLKVVVVDVEPMRAELWLKLTVSRWRGDSVVCYIESTAFTELPKTAMAPSDANAALPAPPVTP